MIGGFGYIAIVNPYVVFAIRPWLFRSSDITPGAHGERTEYALGALAFHAPRHGYSVWSVAEPLFTVRVSAPGSERGFGHRADVSALGHARR
ncbi:hypothetical protein [Nocardia aurantiaca]|uniref:Uncharacterized protein n=1 Tax=Nocardia aurantiaca TaxID=2675850 RepID=A0A6I3KU60_9NOCA|nr:hypothetical protein [Nocardia aurantiaca]MTE12586.1 hypothetical protein [Nocardia aurantiaca]